MILEKLKRKLITLVIHKTLVWLWSHNTQNICLSWDFVHADEFNITVTVFQVIITETAEQGGTE